MLGRAKEMAIAVLAAGIGLDIRGQPSLEEVLAARGLEHYGRRRRTSGGNGKVHCAAHAKRKRQLKSQAIAKQRAVLRERS